MNHFFPYAAIWRIPQRGAHFLIRLSDQQASYAKRAGRLGDDQWIVEFHPTSATRRKDPDLPKVLSARLLRYQWPGFRASWLLTSLLDPRAHTHTELVHLYHRRWQIETIYREWKHGLDIQNLRSHTPQGVIKEIYAHLLLSNLVRWVMTDAVQSTDLHPVDLSYVTALTHVKNALLHMLRADARRIQVIYQRLLQEVRNTPIRKRPRRSYPRRSDKARNRGNGHVQQSARIVESLISSYEPPFAQVGESLAEWKLKALGGASVRGGGDQAVGCRWEAPGRPWGRRKRGGRAPTPPDSAFFAQASSTAGCSGP